MAAQEFTAQVIVEYGPFRTEEAARQWAANMEALAETKRKYSKTMHTEVHIWEHGK